MRRFIITTSLLSLPIILCFLFTKLYYNESYELLRLGYIINRYPAYRDVFQDEFNRKIVFDKISERKNRKKYTVLTIGDSFSEQDNFGYQNYLCDSGVSILHFDQKLRRERKHKNTIQTTYNLLNGDFLEHHQVKYIILESVERDFVTMLYKLDTTKRLTLSEIDLLIDNLSVKTEQKQTNYPTARIVKFPYYTAQYFLKDDFYFPQVYRIKLKDNLFSAGNNDLLCFNRDIELLSINNQESEVARINNYLNILSDKLKAKGVTLIVLPAPDKYDLYYEYILHKENYEKPLFFDHMRKLEKKYIYVESKDILSRDLKRKKDMYFYDDTHWSPWASMIIADELKKIVE
jgi:hypothetical protein